MALIPAPAQAGVTGDLIICNQTCHSQHVSYNGRCLGYVAPHSDRVFHCVHDYSGQCFTITSNAGPTHCEGCWNDYRFTLVR